jgi:hypothetical protein
MHRSSETIGAIAAALAKAQGELTNPEKSLVATIPIWQLNRHLRSKPRPPRNQPSESRGTVLSIRRESRSSQRNPLPDCAISWSQRSVNAMVRTISLWAHRQLAAKNTLAAADARAVEVAYQSRLEDVNPGINAEVPDPTPAAVAAGLENGAGDAPELDGQPSPPIVTPRRKEVRRRNKAHLAFVAAQPCLVCRRSPSDAII